MPEELEYAGALEGDQEKKVEGLENEAIVSNTAEMIANPFGDAAEEVMMDAKQAKLKDPNLLRATERVVVEHLNFRSEKFNTAPQEAESVETVKEMEKYLRDTNAMMEDIEVDNIELEKSVKKQEIIVERITKLNLSNQNTASRLSKKQIERDATEVEKFNEIKTDLDGKLAELEENRTLLTEKVPTDMQAKIAFVNSKRGQGLIEDLLATLGQNNQDLIALAESMVTERAVVTEDPRTEFEEVVTLLQEKHEWLDGATVEVPLLEGAKGEVFDELQAPAGIAQVGDNEPEGGE